MTRGQRVLLWGTAIVSGLAGVWSALEYYVERITPRPFSLSGPPRPDIMTEVMAVLLCGVSVIAAYLVMRKE